MRACPLSHQTVYFSLSCVLSLAYALHWAAAIHSFLALYSTSWASQRLHFLHHHHTLHSVGEALTDIPSYSGSWGAFWENIFEFLTELVF